MTQLSRPPINGILESALYVADLDRSIDFYRRIFGFDVLLQEDRMAGLNVAGQQVLLLFRVGGSTEPSPTPGGTIPPHDGRGTIHFAFAITKDTLDPWRHWLREQNVSIESEVQTERGGHSVYFRDPDNHLVEVATPGLWDVY